MSKKKGLIWANLLHLGYNMWEDRGPDHRLAEGEKPKYPPRTYLRFETPVWNLLMKKMAETGMNMAVIDLGEGVKYESHPELAVRNSWTHSRLKKELGKMREMGIEPIPKLNFSACHDNWLGKYSRCLSTDIYYGVCRDIIEEVIALFDRPRFFHLGMDEETAGHQKKLAYAVIRQYELWWHDLYYLVNETEKSGVRAWVWSDYIWNHREEFLEKMPKSVVQSNWYYGKVFDESINYVKAYLDLESHGYDQIPTGSNHSCTENLALTAEYCRKHVSPSKLLGFLQTPWRPTIKHYRQHHLQAIEAVAKAMEIDSR
ncbi:MAG TPA: Tat pathway signal protein [bacterium]|nr:Tat pathway signal protein [bacterium]